MSRYIQGGGIADFEFYFLEMFRRQIWAHMLERHETFESLAKKMHRSVQWIEFRLSPNSGANGGRVTVRDLSDICYTLGLRLQVSTRRGADRGSPGEVPG